MYRLIHEFGDYTRSYYAQVSPRKAPERETANS